MKKSAKKRKEKIFVFSAHSDDFVIGAGGTIAQYVQEGKKVYTIIFTKGEKSHPWMKGGYVAKMRQKETWAAAKILNCKPTFLDLQEGRITENYHSQNKEEQLLKLLERIKPQKIFTHSAEDPHPDHKSVKQITLELVEKLSFKPEVYIYSVWNPVSLRTSYPALYVKITNTFSLKLKALKSFHSQYVHVSYPFFLLLFRALKDGWKLRTLFGEMFYRIK